MVESTPSERRSIDSYQDFLAAILSDRERFFEAVVAGDGLRAKLRYAIVTIVALSGFFGLVAGAYSGAAQALASGIKLPLLIFVTFLICFPAFFVVQILVGSRLRLLQVVVLVGAALALTSVLLAAFVPITLFFLLIGANYYFQHLLNIAIAGVAGLFGIYVLHEGLSVVCEKRGVYPRKALTIMRVWAVLFAFVGIQLAWNLRPFLGDRNQPFRVVGTYQGNFYAAIIYAARQLLAGEDEPAAPARRRDTSPPFRGLPFVPGDSLADTSGGGTRP
ncbi:MAG: actin-binding WH2 domain-containing protein [Gemmatimonadales bacterium]